MASRRPARDAGSADRQPQQATARQVIDVSACGVGAIERRIMSAPQSVCDWRRRGRLPHPSEISSVGRLLGTLDRGSGGWRPRRLARVGLPSAFRLSRVSGRCQSSPACNAERDATKIKDSGRDVIVRVGRSAVGFRLRRALSRQLHGHAGNAGTKESRKSSASTARGCAGSGGVCTGRAEAWTTRVSAAIRTA